MSAPIPLSPTDVADLLEVLGSRWRYESNALVCVVTRGDFEGSVALVNAIAPIAQRLAHHPDIAISWSRVIVRVSTHELGRLSDKDAVLAKEIEDLLLTL